MAKPIDLLTHERPDSLLAVRDLLDRVRRGDIQYYQSPENWRDEVLYFLLPDRFSDGKESSRPLLTRQEIIELRQLDHRPDWNWKAWAESGKRWQGGNIKGIESKLDYLKGLGISTIWVGPVFKQRARLDSYHGYGVQDFLEIDERFGTRRDLIELISAAHSKNMRVILDIIMNHSGDNWGYVPPGRLVNEAIDQPDYVQFPDYYGNPENSERRNWDLAWKNEYQQGFTRESSDLRGRHDGVWPREFQDEAAYTRAGSGDLGAGDINNPHAEHKRTDFFSLKDFTTDNPDVLSYIAECYKYWIALTDCDGFRLDTVKHIAVEEARNFCGAIAEFAEGIGKNNFLLVGEIAGGDFAQDVYLDQLAVLSRNLDAALDIGEARINIQKVAKGLNRGKVYFDGFDQSSSGFDSHRAIGDRHVSIVDDHDLVTTTIEDGKLRFSALIPDDSPVKDYHIVAATAIQLFTLGIPCIYYGSEQAFAGPAFSQHSFILQEGFGGGDHSDRYLREAMFGPEHPRADFTHDLETQIEQLNTDLPGFGPFGTAGKHCFDTNSPAYIRIAALCDVRSRYRALRFGRQYLRQIRLPGSEFHFPEAGELLAWSRILDFLEAVCIVNPNGMETRGGDIIVSSELWEPGTEFTVIANTAQTAAGEQYTGTHSVDSKVVVKGRDGNLPAFIEIRDIQPAEVVVLFKV
jgi:glycosidase